MLKDNDIKFIADDMLGRLAKWLRILGYDIIYYRSINNKELMALANLENRTLLTRDTDITSSGKAHNCILIENDNYKEQLKQVLGLLSMRIQKQKIFSRCLICNESLKPINRNDVMGKVPPFVFETQDEFVACCKCSKIYWKGTHSSRVEEIIRKVFDSD